MAYKEVTGNLFASNAMALVNTVNCVGAMGKGIALEFRRRFPEMFRQYQIDCDKKILVPGRIYSYMSKDRLILNFAIKDNWKYPSKIQWIEACLKQFAAHYQKKGIDTIAFPWMGAENGGIPLEIIQAVMRKHLQPLEGIEIEVYTFDPIAYDPLFEQLQKITFSEDPDKYQTESGVQRKFYSQIIEAVRGKTARGMSEISRIKGIGKTTIDHLYVFLTQQLEDSEGRHQEKKDTSEIQLTLFEQ